MRANIRILIVEDEVLTAKSMESEIRKMGYDTINIAISYTKAMQSIKSQTPDLILLDIKLKGKYTGIDIANEKEVLNKIPIIYLTGCTESKTINNLLATNPKSYLSKPIKYKDLQVAIALALEYKKESVEIGYGFSYDLKNRNLFRKQKPIKLSPNEKLLLEKLIKEKGEFVPSNILEFAIWGNEVKSDSSLRTLVGNLRKKLKAEVEMIKTIPYFGYKLILPKDRV